MKTLFNPALLIFAASILAQCQSSPSGKLTQLPSTALSESADKPTTPRDDTANKISQFSKCLQAKPDIDVTTAVGCLPPGCQFEFVRSDSLQESCTLDIPAECTADRKPFKLDLPRVIARCGERQLIATWSFCVGSEHLELGVHTDDGRGVYLWDLAFPIKGDDSFRPLVNEGSGSACNTCHFDSLNFEKGKNPFYFQAMRAEERDQIKDGENFLGTLCATLDQQTKKAPSCIGTYSVADEADKRAPLQRLRAHAQLCKKLQDYRRAQTK